MITINKDYPFSWNKEEMIEVVKQTIPDWEKHDILIDGDDVFDRIYLKMDGDPYIIRTWTFNEISEDACHIPVTLYKDVEDEDGGSHGETVCHADVFIGEGDFHSCDLSNPGAIFESDFKSLGIKSFSEDNDDDEDDAYEDFVIEDGVLLDYIGIDFNIVIPKIVTSIGDGAFFNYSFIKSIKMPESVTSIGNEAFADCSSLESITISGSVTSIGVGAFLRCSSLKSITIPKSIKHISSYTFAGCTSLASIVIPDTVTDIDDYAFKDIDDYAFEDSNNLTIKAPLGSYAEQYAREKNIPFEAID